MTFVRIQNQAAMDFIGTNNSIRSFEYLRHFVSSYLSRTLPIGLKGLQRRRSDFSMSMNLLDGQNRGANVVYHQQQEKSAVTVCVSRAVKKGGYIEQP